MEEWSNLVCTPKAHPLRSGSEGAATGDGESGGLAVAQFEEDKRVAGGWQNGSSSKYVAKTLGINSVNKAVNKQRMSI